MDNNNNNNNSKNDNVARICTLQELIDEDLQQRKEQQKAKDLHRRRVRYQKKRQAEVEAMSSTRTPNKRKGDDEVDAASLINAANAVSARKQQRIDKKLMMYDDISKDMEEANREDTKLAEAITHMMYAINVGNVLQTPGPTPAASRAPSRAASPVPLEEHFFGQRYVGQQMLSPLHEHHVATDVKAGASLPTGMKEPKMQILIGSYKPGSLSKPNPVGKIISGVQDMVLVMDCVVLLINGKLQPYAYQPNGSIWGKYAPTTFDKSKKHGLEIDDAVIIDRVKSNNTHLVAFSGSTLYCFMYNGSGTASFTQICTVDNMRCRDIVLGLNKVLLLEEAGGKALQLRVLALDTLFQEQTIQGGTIIPLKANRLTAKLVSLDDPWLIAYDKNGKGKAFRLKDDGSNTLLQIQHFNNGNIADMASTHTIPFACSVDTGTLYFFNWATKKFVEVFGGNTEKPFIRELEAGGSFVLGVSGGSKVVVVEHGMDAHKKSAQETVLSACTCDLKEIQPNFVKMMAMKASSTTVCFVVEVDDKDHEVEAQDDVKIGAVNHVAAAAVATNEDGYDSDESVPPPIIL